MGLVLTIRKFARIPYTAEDLVRLGTLTEEVLMFLRACVEARLNIIVSGGTGSGKTTLLNVLSAFIPPDERIVTIEDAAELQLKQEHVVTLEARPPNIEGRGQVTIRQLVINALLTFVAKPKIHKRLSRLTSFTEDMRARGKQATAQVLRQEMVPARPRVAAALDIEVEQPVALIEHLRLADNEPVGIECCHLSFEGCETVLQEDLSGSLYELLGQRFGLMPTRAQEELEAGACEAREAQILSIQPGDPVLLIRRRTPDQDQRPFEYVESVYRGDNYLLSVELMVEERPTSR